MSRAYTSNGKRISSMTHARRSWDCPCGRRVWGNGGKASHQRACLDAIQQNVDMHVSLATDPTLHWSIQSRHKVQAREWQMCLNAAVEKAMVRS